MRVHHITDESLQTALLINNDHTWKEHLLEDLYIATFFKHNDLKWLLKEALEDLALILVAKVLNAADKIPVFERGERVRGA